MKDASRTIRFLLLTLCAAGLVLGLGGCASTDPDNYSGRPWNTPKTWEGGLPAGIMEGR